MDRFTRGIAMASARHPWRTIAAGSSSWGPCSSSPPAAAAPSPTTSRRRAARAPAPWTCSTRTSPRRPRARPWSSSRPRTATTLDGHRADVEAVLDDVAGLEHVESVADPFAAGTISEDGRIGFAELTLDVPEREMGKPAFTVLSDAVSGTDVSGSSGRAGRRRRLPERRGRDLGPHGHRPPGRAPGPARRVRHPRGGRRADRAVDHRGRRRRRRHHPAGRRHGRVGLGHPGRRPRGTRRRNRLRPLRGGPLPREPDRRQANERALRQRHGHLRRCRRLRGRHRRHRHRRAGHHRPRRPDLDRPVHRPDGVLRRRRGRSRCSPPCSACWATRSTPAGWSVGTARPSATEDTVWWRFGHRVVGTPVAVPARRRRHPGRPRDPGLLDPDRLPGRRRRPRRDHPPPGVRPAVGGLRRGHQRAAPRRRRPERPGRRRRRHRRPHRGHRLHPADRLGQRTADLGRRRHRGLHRDPDHGPGRPRHLDRHRPGA